MYEKKTKKKRTKNTFVLLKPDSITILFDGIRAVSIHHPSMTSSAEKMTDIFTRAFDLFGSCLRDYNSSHCMAEKDIDDLGNITKYSRTHHIYLFFFNGLC